MFEREPGESWIRYADASGRIHHEKIGPSIKFAQAAYQKRKTEMRERRFFPEKIKRRDILFSELAADDLDYSRTNKGRESYRNDRRKMNLLLNWFRDCVAAEITPQEIERRLAELFEEGRTPATINRYRTLLSLVYSLACRNG